MVRPQTDHFSAQPRRFGESQSFGGPAGIHSVQRVDTKFLLILIFLEIFSIDRLVVKTLNNFHPRARMSGSTSCFIERNARYSLTVTLFRNVSTLL